VRRIEGFCALQGFRNRPAPRANPGSVLSGRPVALSESRRKPSELRIFSEHRGDLLCDWPDGCGESGNPRLTTAQNEERKKRRLTMPVLAIGGEESGGEGPANAMKLVADDVQGVVLAGAAHWVAEQAPEELLAALTKFLASSRDS
jgi:pimeloyl-ACP methyl ester carboxylesterase